MNFIIILRHVHLIVACSKFKFALQELAFGCVADVEINNIMDCSIITVSEFQDDCEKFCSFWIEEREEHHAYQPYSNLS